eukprot:4925662-Pleurochrysis_carterae.AAC.7
MEHVNAKAFVRDSPELLDILRYQAAPGYCAATTDGDTGDCDNGEQGMWPLGPHSTLGIVDTGSCVAACYRCSRCNYVSVSVAAHDCSWYHACNMSALHGAIAVGHWSVDVRLHFARASKIADKAAGLFRYFSSPKTK